MADQPTQDKVFQEYLAEISNVMIDEKSSYRVQLDVIEEQFLKFGLTNEQLAQIISDINGKATQYITQYANASAIELIKRDENRELLEQQVLLAKEEVLIKKKELLIKKEELEIKKQDLLIRIEELEGTKAKTKLTEAQVLTEVQKELLMKEQIKTEIQETALKKEQVLTQKKETILKGNQGLTEVQEKLLKTESIKESKAKECLIRAQCVTEGKQQGLLSYQAGLVGRQTTGYDDNRRVKKSEHLSGIAGFAVNAGADDAGSMVTAATAAANSI